MVEEIRRQELIDLHLGINVTEITRQNDGWHLRSKDGTWEHTCRLLLIADGAQSSFARKEAGLVKRPEHNAGAVRAYMEGVTGFHPDGYIELHFLKEYLPGYFWAFPLPNGESNIGLGMRSDKLKERGISLRTEMERIIDGHPLLGQRFAGAKLQEKIVGYPLPLGSKLRRASGAGFMVLGDAGHMIDPLTGEGIGNAMYAGIIAADQALVSLRQNDLSADALSDYDVRIARVLGREMEVSYRIQTSLRYPFLINGLANFIHSRPRLVKLMSRMYTDLDLRAKAAKPGFWIQAAMGRSF
jgi:flavin-dependent dehydrogenase